MIGLVNILRFGTMVTVLSFILSYTYTCIALDTRILAQAYRPSQIELSSPGIQKSSRGLIRGLIPGPEVIKLLEHKLKLSRTTSLSLSIKPRL